MILKVCIGESISEDIIQHPFNVKTSDVDLFIKMILEELDNKK